jgi:hypothetical protein
MDFDPGAVHSAEGVVELRGIACLTPSFRQEQSRFGIAPGSRRDAFAKRRFSPRILGSLRPRSRSAFWKRSMPVWT